MAAFAYQHMAPFLLDSSVFLQNMTKNLNLPSGGLLMEVEEDGFMMDINCRHSYGNYPPSHDHHHHLQLAGSQLVKSSNTSVGDGDVNGSTDSMTKEKPLQSVNVTDQSSSESEEQVTQKVTTTISTTSPMDMKRKNSNGSSLDCAQPKGGREGGSKRRKKVDGDVTEDQNNGKPEKKDQKKINDQGPPTGYIHVRARRGQATDSHSLAERVRREKISEKMKTLQRLVPGCDKVNGKALMLDEIINYVQSLQNQVEFLSMKLASTNPLFYEFGIDLDGFMVLPERPSNMESPSLSPMQQCSSTQTTTFADANTTTTTVAATTIPAATAFGTSINYPSMDSCLSQILQGQRPIEFTQDTANMLWDLEEQSQKFINPSWFSSNLSIFH